MRRSHAIGAPIDVKRLRGWADRFGPYRGVTSATISSWLDQFDKADTDLAARLLDVVDFYGLQEIHLAYRQALQSLDGWNIHKTKRQGTWRFAAMSGSAGESGDSMLHHFRVANGLATKAHNELFIHRSQLASLGLGPDDTVVLLDDFSGTGTQICEAWNDAELSYGELLASVGRVCLILVAATQAAVKKIQNETLLTVFPAYHLDHRDNVFATGCKQFTSEDRKRLLEYCTKASRKQPRGYGDCGLVVVFQHRTPNNSISILHTDNGNGWSALFPRHG